MTQSKNPAIRFEGFTDDWEQRKLNEIVSLFGGNGFKSTDSEEKGIRWLKIANVGIGKIDWTTSSYLPIEYWEKFSNYQLFKNDYVMALTRPILNSKLKIAQVDTKCLLNQRVAKLKFFVHSEYGYQLLNKKDTITLMENELAGTDPPNLGSKNLENIEVYITNSEIEQSKIGNFFKQLDNTITLQERELELLKEQKKGFLQKMFPKQNEKVPELRFKGFADDWEQRKLKDFADSSDKYSFTGGPFGSDLKSSDYTEKGVRIIQLQNIGDGIFFNDYKIYTSNEKANLLSSNLIYSGEIIIAKMAEPLARATIIPNFEGKYLMASDGIRLKVDTKKYDNYFILSLINHPTFRKLAMENSTGTTRKRIGLVTLGSLLTRTPNFEEQIKIGNFFKQLDETITLQEQQLEKMKEMKKGFLQKMFV